MRKQSAGKTFEFNRKWKVEAGAPNLMAFACDLLALGVENSQVHLDQETVLGVVIGGFGELR